MIDDETILRRIASAVIEEDRAQRLRCGLQDAIDRKSGGQQSEN